MIRLRSSQAVAGLTTGRITAFSDGVFSIAITLLVLNLQVPKLLFPLYYIFPSRIDLHLTPTSRTKEEPEEHEDSTGEDSSIAGGEGEDIS